MTRLFTVYRYLFTRHYPFTVFHEAQWLMANGECMVNGKLKMVNGTGGAV